jgi:large subunit ribosomal protein L17
MRHAKSGYKLGRTASHRRAMLRNMVTSLFEHERITTTEVKAKALKPLAEKMITLAKRGDLHARRQALSVLTKKDVTHKLFSEIKDRYMDRAGGYITIVRVGVRQGDCAEMAVIQLIKPDDRVKTTRKKPRRKKDGRPAAKPPKEAKKEAASKPKVTATEPAPVTAEAAIPDDAGIRESAPPDTDQPPVEAHDEPGGESVDEKISADDTEKKDI